MLTVDVSPVSSGTLTLTGSNTIKIPVQYPESFDCFNWGNDVTVEAAPAPGYEFDHWEGGLTGIKNPDTIVRLTEAVSVTAYFKESPLPKNKAVELTAAAAKRMLDSRADIIVIDISQTPEFEVAHLICSLNYPWASGEFSESYTDLIPFQDYTIIIYDQDGTQSKAAAAILAENNFPSIYYMAGGLNAWQNNGSLTVNSDCDCETCSLPPIANAGPDQTADEGTPVTLTAGSSASPSGSITSYQWEQFGGEQTVVLSNPSAERPSFIAPYVQQGGDELIFHVTVSDNNNNTDTDSVAISVSWYNDPPKADAGPDQTVETGQTVILDGSGSYDPEGSIAGYSWAIDAGSFNVELSDNNSLKPEFPAPVSAGWIRFLLTVADANGKTDTDSVTIVIDTSTNPPPDANAGPDQTVDEGETVQLNGSGSEALAGNIEQYHWEQTEGPEVKLSNAYAVMPSFLAPVIDKTTELVFGLTVKDSNGLTDADAVTVLVENTTDCPWNAVKLEWDCPDTSDDENENDSVAPDESEAEESDTGGGGSSCFITSSFK